MVNTEELEQYRVIEAVQQELWQQLHALPDVVGSAIGHKVMAGKDTKKVCLVLFVSKKNDLSASHPSMIFLQNLTNRGILTDVVERPHTSVPLPLIHTDELVKLDQSRTDKFDPMIGGISCGPDVNIIKFPYSGTLGISVLRTASQELGILSNHHVMYYDATTKKVCQPARTDSIFNYTGGDKLEAYMGNVTLQGIPTYVDCAVATVLEGRSATRKTLFGIKTPVTGILSRNQVAIGDQVVKSGLSSAITTGTVRYLSVSGPDGIEPNQFAIMGNDGKDFAKSGDSGSVVLKGDKVMGLLWGKNEDDGITYAMVSPIEAVLETLGIEI
ncbi:hypothetical protein SIO70_28670 [Chitinophaga sancti]|uniref:hypothetical protein n=1 Tax=Chitinophaga sancti TaxID=1004 RepID=UPI002A76628F|nr:hypothetical protein [Chitinophaga sancti]WPQ62338.1 hypothetical protein SIO70_28670 [Chitinophaga sancti]